MDFSNRHVVVTGGTGALGTLNFVTGQKIWDFTVNRISSGSVTLGTPLTVGTSLTRGEMLQADMIFARE